MQLLNPLLLWGLAAAAVPIVIHLLNKRRFQRQRWAAMEWLLAAAKKTQKRLVWENLLLLLVRTAAVLLLALAITRPSFSNAQLLLGAARRTHLYVLLDNSASTGALNGSRPVFDESLSAVSSLVAGLADEDPVSLVLTNDNSSDRRTGRPIMLLRETRDHAAVRRRLGELKPANARADLADALKLLEESVPGTGAVLRRVAIVSDMQSVTLEGLREGDRKDDPVRAILERLKAKGAEVVPIAVGREAANVAITDLRAAEGRDVVQGAMAIFQAEVRNFSDRPQKIEVTFEIDGEKRGVSTQSVPPLPARAAGAGQPPGQTAQYWTTFSERDIGVHVLTATIRTDALAIDDTRTLAFTVRPQIKVLLVDGDPSPGPNRESEVEWLRNAVGLQENGPFAPSVMTEERFLSLRALEDWDVVVLANVSRPAPSDESRRRLEDYVRGGGSLFLTVGDHVDPSRWNEELYRREGGLLPARLGAAKVDKSAVLRFDMSASRHPILAEITNPSNTAFFESPILHGFMTTEGLEGEKDARVVLRLTDLPKTPILVEKRFGRGIVLLFTSTIDDDWGRLLGSLLYPAFVHESIYHLTSRGNADRNLLAFQPWTRTVPANFVSMEITKPDGSVVRTERDISADASYVTFTDTELTGRYAAQGQLRPTNLLEQAPPPLRDAFAVNLTPLESDLRRVAPEELFARWRGLVSTSETAVVAAEAARARAGEIAFPLLLAALVCLLIEIFLVQRIGRKRR